MSQSTDFDNLAALKGVEAWGRHAPGANGLGDTTTTDRASSERPTSYELHQAARAHRSFTLAEIIVASTQAIFAVAHRATARRLQRREARAVVVTLRELGDGTLRDLGFDRSEISSVAAELTGRTAHTRVRAPAAVAQSNEHSSSLTPLRTTNSATGPQQHREEMTMHRYETSTPRVAFAVAAVAMTAITLGVFVVVPATIEPDSREPNVQAASKVSAPVSVSAVSGARIDVAATHGPGLATALRTLSKPNRKPEG